MYNNKKVQKKGRSSSIFQVTLFVIDDGILLPELPLHITDDVENWVSCWLGSWRTKKSLKGVLKDQLFAFVKSLLDDAYNCVFSSLSL